MDDAVQEFDSDMKTAVNECIASGADPHVIEQVLQHYSQQIRMRHGEPAITLDEIQDAYGLDFSE